VLALARLAGGDGGLSPALPLLWSDLALISLSPVLAATVALAAAWLAARGALDRAWVRPAGKGVASQGSVE